MTLDDLIVRGEITPDEVNEYNLFSTLDGKQWLDKKRSFLFRPSPVIEYGHLAFLDGQRAVIEMITEMIERTNNKLNGVKPCQPIIPNYKEVYPN